MNPVEPTKEQHQEFLKNLDIITDFENRMRIALAFGKRAPIELPLYNAVKAVVSVIKSVDATGMGIPVEKIDKILDETAFDVRPKKKGPPKAMKDGGRRRRRNTL
jgi:hypothetical protein